MATQNPDIAFVVKARDQASAVFNRLSQSSGRLGVVWRGLTGIIARLSASMIALSIALPIVAAAFASLITAATAVSFVSFERGARRTRVQLQLLGFTALEARDQVNTLTDLMDRAAVTSFFASQQAINNIALAGFELNAVLIPLSEKFADIIQANPSQVFNALFDALARHDPTKFARLVTGVENLAIPMAVLDKLDAGDSAPFLRWLERIIETEQLTKLEDLTSKLERIAELTKPTREAIVEAMAVAVGILIESLVTHLEKGSERIELILKTAFVVGVLAGGQNLGRSLGLGLMAGLTVILLGNLVDTIQGVIESPAVISGIFVIGTGLGLQLGGIKGGIVAGIVIAIGLELLPGLTDAFDKLSTDQQLSVAALVLGTAIGLGLRLGVLRSFALGFILKDIINNLHRADSITDQALFIGLVALGAAMGFVIAGPMGAIIGTSLAIAALNMADENGEVIQAFLKFGDELARQINRAVLNGLANLPIEIANLGIRAINDIINAFNALPFVPDIGNVPVVPGVNPGSVIGPSPIIPFIGPSEPPTTFGGSPTTPGPGGTPFDPNAPFVPDPDFAHGGMVPGPLGAPVRAIVHGGETVLPGGATMIIQLVLDRRIVSEIAVDAVNRTARLNAGMVPGSIGS